MANQNILDSDYTKLLYIKLEELKDNLTRINIFLSKKTDLETATKTITDKIAEVKNQTNNIESDTSITLTTTHITDGKVDTLSNNVTSVMNSVSSIETNVLSLSQDTADTKTTTQEIKTLIPSAKEEILAEFPKAKENFDNALADLLLKVTNQYKAVIALVSETQNTVRLESDEIQTILGDIENAINTLQTNVKNSNVDYELIKTKVYDTLLPKFTELSDLISGLNFEVDTARISTAVKESLAEDFSTVNANINALSTQISSGGSAIEIDTAHLNSLIESMEFVVSKRKYYEPLPENYEVTDPSTYTVTNIKDVMKGDFVATSESTPTYNLPFVYFQTQVGCVYCLQIDNTMYSYKEDTKIIKVYLNGELVKSLTAPINTDYYSMTQLANISYGFLATQEYNELKLEYFSSINNSFVPKTVSITLHGPNGKIHTCIPKFKVERVFDNYYIYKKDNTTYQCFITPVDNPEILPNSTKTYVSNGYTQINATMHRTATADVASNGVYDIYINSKNIATSKVNANEIGTNSKNTYIYAIMMGFQPESNTTLYSYSLDSTNTLRQGNVDKNNAPSFYTITHTVEGKMVRLTQICDLTALPYAHLFMFGVTLDNNDNYLLHKKTGYHLEKYYIGKGDRWNMGIVAKNEDGTNVRLILRSYMYRNRQWIREEFLVYNTGDTITITKINSYLIEDDYDFMYCGSNNDYFSQTDGDFAINKHLPVDYTEYLTFPTDETTDENTEEIPRLT